MWMRLIAETPFSVVPGTFSAAVYGGTPVLLPLDTPGSPKLGRNRPPCVGANPP
jgi:hypothetical protein